MCLITSTTPPQVKLLCKRYIKARGEYRQADQEFEDLNSTVDPALLAEWTVQEEIARTKRASDVTEMDIYDVQHNTGTV